MSILVALQGPVIYTYSASGGLTFSGLGTVKRIAVVSGVGGFVFAGTASLKRTFAVVSTGGVVFSGASTIKRTAVVLSSGGIVFDGAALATFTLLLRAGSVSGQPQRRRPVVRVERVARSVKPFAYEGRGGVRFAGTARVEWDRRRWQIPAQPFPYIGTGGLTVSGHAPATFVRVFVSETTGRLVAYAGTASAVLDTRLADLWRDEREVLEAAGIPGVDDDALILAPTGASYEW